MLVDPNLSHVTSSLPLTFPEVSNNSDAFKGRTRKKIMKSHFFSLWKIFMTVSWCSLCWTGFLVLSVSMSLLKQTWHSAHGTKWVFLYTLFIPERASLLQARFTGIHYRFIEWTSLRFNPFPLQIIQVLTYMSDTRCFTSVSCHWLKNKNRKAKDSRENLRKTQKDFTTLSGDEHRDRSGLKHTCHPNIY